MARWVSTLTLDACETAHFPADVYGGIHTVNEGKLDQSPMNLIY